MLIAGHDVAIVQARIVSGDADAAGGYVLGLPGCGESKKKQKRTVEMVRSYIDESCDEIEERCFLGEGRNIMCRYENRSRKPSKKKWRKLSASALDNGYRHGGAPHTGL